MAKKSKKIKETRPQKFCKFVAQGLSAYQSALNAGYSKSYALNHSHKLSEKYQNKIEELKPLVKEAIEEEFKYSVKDSFQKLKEIQDLALLPNEKGDYCNLSSAIKAEELKGRMYGVYETDNTQKAGFNIVVADKKLKEAIEDI